LPALEVQSRTARKGVLSLDGRRIMFELRGSDGLYGDESNSIFFDLDSDGKFDSQTRYSAEEYKVKERWINIGNRSYEFSVDRFGDKLTLRPTMDKRKDRADLREGHTAPDFTFDDLEGKHRRLSDLNGKVVLLHIWAPWCAPSAAEAPAWRLPTIVSAKEASR
jgi:thiol-disulfide isomerase/thioredoxin